MGKISFVLTLAVLVFTLSCNSGQQGNTTTTTTTTDSGQQPGNIAHRTALDVELGDSFCTFIPKDSANKMISSYISSIGGGTSGNDSNLYSLIVDVKALADYLNAGGTSRKATKLKLMFAHSLNYINNGGQGQNCGYQSGKLTLVIAAYDSAGNYIYKNGTAVLERLQPCPSNCPSSGTASGNLLE